MKALVKTGPGKGITYKDVDKPTIRTPDEVLVNIKTVSICASDVPIYNWTGWGIRAMEHAEYPMTPGHEAAGDVVEVGESVSTVKPGDRITINSLFTCGQCFYCLRGLDNVCEHRVIFGKKTGAYAEYVTVPERAAIKLPDELTYEEGALLEALGVAIHAVDQGTPQPGEYTVILGCGPIGMMASKYMDLFGTNNYSTEISKDRIRFAEKLGINVIDASSEDIVQRILDETEGRGADFVLESTGNENVMQQALDMVRNVGRIVTIGTFAKPITMDVFFKISRKELRLMGNLGRPIRDWYRAITLVERGRIDLKPFITHKFKLEEYEKAFEAAGSPTSIKVLLYP